MKEPCPSSCVQVRTPAAAAVFADSRRRRLLLQFVGQGRSLAEVAQATGQPIGYVHYHARRWVTLGLLEIGGERRRAGRPVKLYRAPGDGFFVADAHLSRSANAGLLDELYRGLDQVRAHEEDAGTHFTVEDGKPRMRRVDGKARQPIAEIWRVIELDERAAAALVSQLQSLARSAGDRSERPAREYLLHLALAPRPRS